MNELRLGKANQRSEYYSRFSEDEFERRHTRIRKMMDKEDLDAIIIYGNSGYQQSEIFYLTNYLPGFATYLLFFRSTSEPSTMFVGISNHLQYTREISEVDDLRLLLPSPASKVAARINESDAAEGTVGIIGVDPRYELTISYTHYRQLKRELKADLVDATVPFIHCHSVKSDTEIKRVKEAARIVDRGMEAIEEKAASGITERDLEDKLRSVYIEEGGRARASFISSAPMEGAEPGEPLPWKEPSSRTIKVGDIITTEIAASYRGYISQIHRPYAVGRPPTSTYEDIYDIAEETYENMVDAVRAGNTAQDIHDAMAPVEESDYKIYDVMFHGYGLAYRHPFIGTVDSNYWPGSDDPTTANWEFQKNMVMVVQPNLFTPDERHGFQLGTTVVVRDGAPEVIQEYPVGFIQV